jgi:hypothetical protein
MHNNILSKEQIELLPFIQSFKKEYYMVGGTAVSLQIGHRESIDFDMFKLGNVQPAKIAQRLEKFGWDFKLIYKNHESFHIIANDVKITFFQYPFEVKTTKAFEGIKMPDLLNLAAMKAYALGRRTKWKDYVDLYFILKNYHAFDEISNKAEEIFKGLFSPKLFKNQLCYFDDINYSEEVTYCIDPIPDEEIKAFLLDLVIKQL